MSDVRERLEERLRAASEFLVYCRGTEPAEMYEDHASTVMEAAALLASLPDETETKGVRRHPVDWAEYMAHAHELPEDPSQPEPVGLRWGVGDYGRDDVAVEIEDGGAHVTIHGELVALFYPADAAHGTPDEQRFSAAYAYLSALQGRSEPEPVGVEDASPFAAVTLYVERCGYCGSLWGELDDPREPCQGTVGPDPETGEPIVHGPHRVGYFALSPSERAALASRSPRSGETEDYGVAGYVWKHAGLWASRPDSYWLQRLMQEVGEAASTIAGDHDGPLVHELRQIASIAINWIRRIDKPKHVCGAHDYAYAVEREAPPCPACATRPDPETPTDG